MGLLLLPPGEVDPGEEEGDEEEGDGGHEQAGEGQGQAAHAHPLLCVQLRGHLPCKEKLIIYEHMFCSN